MLPASIIDLVKNRLGDRFDDYLIPPPVFITMGGEYIAFDLDSGMLTTRFPVLDKYLNPYRFMQGGMVVATVDNTLGPLSMVALPVDWR